MRLIIEAVRVRTFQIHVQPKLDIMKMDYLDTVTLYPCVAYTNKDQPLNPRG